MCAGIVMSFCEPRRCLAASCGEYAGLIGHFGKIYVADRRLILAVIAVSPWAHLMK